MVHKIMSLGHGAKRKRSVDDQGQTTKRQKTRARWVHGLSNITEFYLSLNKTKQNKTIILTGTSKSGTQEETLYQPLRDILATVKL